MCVLTAWWTTVIARNEEQNLLQLTTALIINGYSAYLVAEYLEIVISSRRHVDTEERAAVGQGMIDESI